jgi:hypothetical protein
MTELPKHNFCHFCRRELKAGEGRYRLPFKKNDVECCPACFDTIHTAPRSWPEEPGEERTAGRVENEKAVV